MNGEYLPSFIFQFYLKINFSTVCLIDEKSIRLLVLWLEDQKIRHYKIEDRENLRQVNSPDWKLHFSKYLSDVNCPLKNVQLAEQMEWLIGYAVKLEYSDNGILLILCDLVLMVHYDMRSNRKLLLVDKYKGITAENMKQNKSDVPKVISSNPLDKLDCKFHVRCLYS